MVRRKETTGQNGDYRSYESYLNKLREMLFEFSSIVLLVLHIAALIRTEWNSLIRNIIL